jgi:hypothetical protein
MAGGVRCEVGGGEKRAGEMTGQKLAFGAAHYERTRLPATTSTGRGLSIRRGWRKRAWGGRQRVHLGDMEQTEKVRGAGGKYVGSLQSRYVGEAKPKVTTATARRMVGAGRSAQAGAGSTAETLKASGRWLRAREMQRVRAEAWN